MLERQVVFEIHRLRNEGLSCRQISRELRVSRKAVKRYLAEPERAMRVPQRESKLDPYREIIDGFLEEHPDTPATVILRHLHAQGFTGGISITRAYVAGRKKNSPVRRAYIRVESPPGKQMQVDWAHFGALEYGKAKRRLYAFVITESYSRMLYLEFTHSQKQAVLHQCLINAFKFFGGTPQELVVDNMLTAVTERHGPVIRFNGAFLDFLRPLRIMPVACNVRSPQEKGKVERSVRYIRQSFWPLRQIQNLMDANAQAWAWLDEVANVRMHGGTGDKPLERFKEVRLNRLPEGLPDCRETISVLVHKDFAVRFDGNAYTVPPWNVGRELILKADNQTISIFRKDKLEAQHQRCWETKQRIETPAHVEQVKRLKNRLWNDKDIAFFTSLGDDAAAYLTALADASQPIKKTVTRLLALHGEYGTYSLLYAIRKALEHKVHGADYIENILYQEMTPQKVYPPVKLKDQELEGIRLSEVDLLAYDDIAVKRSKS